jgi:NAD(P)-dependent dehydrogenase (short-subunit alcohol dehydrogenase family)
LGGVDVDPDPIGNGRAAALLFAREGAHVAVADRDLTSAEETVSRIVAEGGRAAAVQADIAREDDVQAMVEEARVAMGGLDGLMLNVGIGVGALNLEGTQVADWDTVLAVNLRGPMLCCREAVPLLDDGSPVVFVSSIAGLQAGSRLVAYDASKAGLAGLMRHVALEGSRRGIRANTVVPGLVDTPLGRAASGGRPGREHTRIPLGRMATGWEIAYAALFLMSDESVYITAQLLTVDGGLTGI